MDGQKRWKAYTIKIEVFSVLPTLVQVIVQASFQHELIHQQKVVNIMAVPNKFNQVWMMKSWQIIHFRLKNIRLLIKHPVKRVLHN